jgi:hypothetical protein
MHILLKQIVKKIRIKIKQILQFAKRHLASKFLVINFLYFHKYETQIITNLNVFIETLPI